MAVSTIHIIDIVTWREREGCSEIILDEEGPVQDGGLVLDPLRNGVGFSQLEVAAGDSLHRKTCSYLKSFQKPLRKAPCIVNALTLTLLANHVGKHNHATTCSLFTSIVRRLAMLKPITILVHTVLESCKSSSNEVGFGFGAHEAWNPKPEASSRIVDTKACKARVY